MTRRSGVQPAESAHANGYQRLRDAGRSDGHRSDVAAWRGEGTRLAGSRPPDRDHVKTVTSALKPSMGTPPTLSWPETPPGAEPLPGQLDHWLAARGAELVAIRRHLHAHPELSGHEFETAALVAGKLAAAGLAPRMLPGGNGVICDIGDGDKVVALRADLDALPLPDTKDVPYRSTVDGVCHACGHDAHTTVMLGAGLALANLAERGALPGRVRLLFQPAEERTPSGAPEVIAAGGLKDVAAIFAVHCAPHIPVGLVGVRSGPFTAAADKVEVVLRGRGGHTARPHLTADLVHALGRVVVDVPALLDRRVDPRAGVSMVFGAVRAGEAANAIPIEGLARGTVRVLNRDAWHELPDLITKLVRDVVAGTGAEVEVNYLRGVPPVINDRMATAVIAGAAGAALGPENVVEAEVSMGGEDFAYYLEHVPGAMIRLGVGVPGADSRVDIHQSSFDIDERAIGHGIRVMVHTALAAMSTPAI
ncbi:MAG TPA: amidohydrolase [Micromonosporaceae bacterium]